jgi:hypothetical protein
MQITKPLSRKQAYIIGLAASSVFCAAPVLAQVPFVFD